MRSTGCPSLNNTNVGSPCTLCRLAIAGYFSVSILTNCTWLPISREDTSCGLRVLHHSHACCPQLPGRRDWCCWDVRRTHAGVKSCAQSDTYIEHLGHHLAWATPRGIKVYYEQSIRIGNHVVKRLENLLCCCCCYIGPCPMLGVGKHGVKRLENLPCCCCCHKGPCIMFGDVS